MDPTQVLKYQPICYLLGIWNRVWNFVWHHVDMVLVSIGMSCGPGSLESADSTESDWHEWRDRRWLTWDWPWLTQIGLRPMRNGLRSVQIVIKNELLLIFFSFFFRVWTFEVKVKITSLVPKAYSYSIIWVMVSASSICVVLWIGWDWFSILPEIYWFYSII